MGVTKLGVLSVAVVVSLPQELKRALVEGDQGAPAILDSASFFNNADAIPRGNEALEGAKSKVEAEMSKATGGMSIPGLG